MTVESIQRQAITCAANLCIISRARHTAVSLSGWRATHSNDIVAIAFARIFDPKVSVTCAKCRAYLNGHLIRSSILSAQGASAAAFSVTCSIIITTDRLDHCRSSWWSGIINPRLVGEQTDEGSIVKVL